MPICMLFNVLKYSIFFVCDPLGLTLKITPFHLVGVIYIKYVICHRHNSKIVVHLADF